jgi:hypothetical protein
LKERDENEVRLRVRVREGGGRMTWRDEPATYKVAVDDRQSFTVGPSSEDALFLLIEQRIGLPRVAAEPMLAKGMLIAGADLMVLSIEAWKRIMPADEEIAELRARSGRRRGA